MRYVVSCAIVEKTLTDMEHRVVLHTTVQQSRTAADARSFKRIVTLLNLYVLYKKTLMYVCMYWPGRVGLFVQQVKVLQIGSRHGSKV